MDSCVSESDFRALESVSVEEEVPIDLDGNLDLDEVFVEDISEGKRKRKGEDVEMVSPVKKQAKIPGTTQSKRPTRSTNKKILKAKRTAVRVNRGKIEENCIVCVRENPTEEAYVGVTRKNGHVWFSLCEEFFEVLEDRKVVEELRGVVMRAKTKKDDEKNKHDRSFGLLQHTLLLWGSPQHTLCSFLRFCRDSRAPLSPWPSVSSH